MARTFDPYAATGMNCSPSLAFSSSSILARSNFGHGVRAWPTPKLRLQRVVSCTLVAGTSQDSSAEVMNLGRTPLRISKLGIGTLQWGDPGSGYGDRFGEEQLASAFDELIKGGINFFDTAEVYGYQGIKSGSSSEQLLGRFLTRPSVQGGGEQLSPVIASKFFTIPWTNFLVGGGFRLGRKSLLAALKESLKRLGKKQIDLYQIHFPFPTFSNSALMESLKEAVEEGLTKAVGVSNYSKDQMEEADDRLRTYGIPLASNQVQFSVLCQKPVEEGLLKSAQERGITLIAYSPLATGLLSAKTFEKNDSKSIQGAMVTQLLLNSNGHTQPHNTDGKVRPLLDLLQSIGADHGGKSVSQVALNYLITKGALPIAGVKTVEQAKAHTETLGWRLTENEVEELEEKRRALKL